MKARLLESWNGHPAGTVVENVQPGTGMGFVPLASAEWFDDDEDVKATSVRTAERAAKAAKESKKK